MCLAFNRLLLAPTARVVIRETEEREVELREVDAAEVFRELEEPEASPGRAEFDACKVSRKVDALDASLIRAVATRKPGRNRFGGC